MSEAALALMRHSNHLSLTPIFPATMDPQDHLVQLHAIDARSCDLHAANACLTTAEVERARRFRDPAEARRWIAIRGRVRHLLGAALNCPPAQLRIIPGPHGKPRLDGHDGRFTFNVSHSGDSAVLAFGFLPTIGVDLETIDRVEIITSCGHLIASDLERSCLSTLPEEESAQAWLRLWTAKEAWLKSLGIGLAVELSCLTVVWSVDGKTAKMDGPPGVIDRARDLVIHAIAAAFLPGARVALAVPPDAEIVCFPPDSDATALQ